MRRNSGRAGENPGKIHEKWLPWTKNFSVFEANFSPGGADFWREPGFFPENGEFSAGWSGFSWGRKGGTELDGMDLDVDLNLGYSGVTVWGIRSIDPG